MRSHSVLKTNVEESFDSILLQAIDETLLVYGRDVRSVFYDYFKKALNIPRHRIPAKIAKFSNGLYGLLGAGAKNIEISIMMKLHLKIGMVWELDLPDQRIKPDLWFIDYVRHAKKYFEEGTSFEDQVSVFLEEKKARLLYR
jgi:hypothetical protein